MDRGITKDELIKYIFALKPSHRYFGKKYQDDYNISSDESDSSFDSAFEEQFADMVKDLPPKLAEKIPRCRSRVNCNDDSSRDEDEEQERDEIDQGNPDSVTRIVKPSSSSQREALLLQKIAHLTLLLEET